MFVRVVLLVSFVTLSAANPVSVRQIPPCGDTSVSTECATALLNYLQAETTLLSGASSGNLNSQVASQIETTFQTNLAVVCADNCKNTWFPQGGVMECSRLLTHVNDAITTHYDHSMMCNDAVTAP